MKWRHRFFVAVVLRLRPVLIGASSVLPSMPPLFQSVERHFLDGQFWRKLGFWYPFGSIAVSVILAEVYRYDAVGLPLGSSSDLFAVLPCPSACHER
jgi:hypothetical protein